MADQYYLDLLLQGTKTWNHWREKHPDVQEVDLSEADLNGEDLSGANLSEVDLSKSLLVRANLSQADLRRAYLTGACLDQANLEGAILSGAGLSEADLSKAYLAQANLSHAGLNRTILTQASLYQANLTHASFNRANLNGTNLSKANLREANLSQAELLIANLREADLSQANLVMANLGGADLRKANLTGANLSWVTLTDVDLRGADLTGCRIYGISVWNIRLEQTVQLDLIITSDGESTITVDHLEVAQFIYLLLNNQKIRDVIDSITSKVVLILGRFTSERKIVLNTLRDELRKQNYTPVLFDFEKPASRDLTETVSTLAHLARFIIVDLTDPSSAPHEVATVIPHTVVPVQPILLQEPLMIDGKVVERREYAMFEDLRRRHHWVLPTFRYQDTAELLASLQAQIIAPAEQKAKELMQPK